MLEPQPPRQRAQGTWNKAPADLTGLVCIYFLFILSASRHCLTLLSQLLTVFPRSSQTEAGSLALGQDSVCQEGWETFRSPQLWERLAPRRLQDPAGAGSHAMPAPVLAAGALTHH